MTNLMQSVKDNLAFLGVCLVIVVAIFVVAGLTEKALRQKNSMARTNSPARRVALVGVFSAIAAVLMLFELPLWFAPSFYELDFSEIPVLICAFAMGPVAGVATELCKVLLKLVLKGTTTAFVGDFANFVVGCSLIIPASAVYSFKKTKKSAIIACIVGTLVMTVFGTAFNAVYLLPAFSKFYGMPMDAILAMGTEVNPLAKEGSIVSFVVACVAPMNLIKGTLVSVVTLLIYKPLSPIIKTGHKA